MTKKLIILGEKEFKFKKDALEYFKDVLNSSIKNRTIEGDHHLLLLDLIERHPDAVQKIGCGIKRFYKAPTGMGTSCFWIERIDGSSTDFSYISAVNAKKKSLYQEFSEACRNVVKEDLKKSKDSFFVNNSVNNRVKCEISGQEIAIYESHLDHKKPMTFEVIVRTFIKANNIEINEDMLSEARDKQFETEFVSDFIKEKFKEYHHNVADLRIIRSKENAILGGSERITKSKNPVRIIKN